jgi:hypothetical protein
MGAKIQESLGSSTEKSKTMKANTPCLSLSESIEWKSLNLSRKSLANIFRVALLRLVWTVDPKVRAAQNTFADQILTTIN